MNQRLWQQHLERRIRQLERDNKRLRQRLTDQHQRAELWKHRALEGAQSRPG